MNVAEFSLIMGHHEDSSTSSSSTTNGTDHKENYCGSNGPLLFVDSHSPGMSDCCWVGAEVQVENKIARRCSYEEMVHEEVLLPEMSSNDFQSDKCTVRKNAIFLCIRDFVLV